ncbi:sigma-E factor negative regulatory protein [Polaromonas sp. YR568]|uniref:sigma-E factor negative regulatory protein n=1 Tax=Polaromonas sp. YR568 TaxID=1855301 RepID=UPI0020C8709C|nr:sigma-E factor negative regulatory protein [Polaromonas sp. YR568]
MQTSELISALADGQLGGEDFAAALHACGQDDSAIDSWDTYHLIGDALRSSASPVLGADKAFLARLNQRLAGESMAVAGPVPVGNPAGSSADVVHVPVVDAAPRHGAAANDADFRWKLVAGFASLAAVSAIAWNAAGLLTPAAAPQLAQAPVSQQVVVASPQGPVVRDARLEELLAAHKQLGGTSALQEPSGFLRNATFETPRNAGR